MNLDRALKPVGSALLESAHLRADALLAAARADGEAAVTVTRAEARETVEAARQAGIDSADQMARARLAQSRRQARQTVLSARRRAYQELRMQAVDLLLRQLDRPEGRDAYDFLVEAVSNRAGGAAVARCEHPGGWYLVAGPDEQRAELDPAALVDQVLAASSPALEAL